MAAAVLPAQRGWLRCTRKCSTLERLLADAYGLDRGGESYIGRVLRLGTQTKAHAQMTRTDSVGNRCTAGLYTATGEHEPPTGCIPRLEART